jgi:hypothetical protein
VDNFQESSMGSTGSDSMKPVKMGNWMWFAVMVIVLVVVVAVGYSLVNVQKEASGVPIPNADKWQAVFLTNGQVYFGHLTAISGEYFNLNEIYYLQVQQVVQPRPEDQPQQPNISLVKLGGELHGPEDMMYIPKDRILFWEDMKVDSRVVTAIEQSKQPQ